MLPLQLQPIARQIRACKPVSLKVTFVHAFAFLVASAITTATGHNLPAKQRRPQGPVVATPPPSTPATAVSPRNAVSRRRHPHQLQLSARVMLPPAGIPMLSSFTLPTSGNRQGHRQFPRVLPTHTSPHTCTHMEQFILQRHGAPLPRSWQRQ